MSKTWVESLMESPDERRLMAQEDAILQVTELVCRLMEEQGISKVELARRMGTSAANITQVLDGRRNMTIRTISDLLFHLDHVLDIQARVNCTKKVNLLRGAFGDMVFHVAPNQSPWQVEKNMPDDSQPKRPKLKLAS